MKSVSKRKVIIVYGLMFLGAALCIVGLIGSGDLNLVSLVGGPMVFLGIILQIFAFRCPYCGSKKAGRALKLSGKPFNCPDCNKEIEVK